MRSRPVLVLVGLLVMSGFATAALSQEAAEEEKKLGWSDAAELSYVMTSGNAEASTLGLKNTLTYEAEESTFTLKAAAVRAEASTFLRRAVGTPTDFVLIEQETSDLTAENYMLAGRYERDITERFFWYAGAGWDRNRFSGIDSRTVVEGGLGNTWIDREDLTFKTSYAGTWTKQEDVVELPDADDSFLGLRLSWEYEHLFGEATTYTNDLVFDENLDETSDWRADMVNSVTVSMTKRLALKASLQWLYENEPAFAAAPLFDPLDPTGPPIGVVPFELDELDTIFTTSLVINFRPGD